MAHLYTTHGQLSREEVGFMLPHEHIFVDLRTPDTPGQGEAEPQPVIDLMAPQLTAIRKQGCTALVECTPEGVGRRADLVSAVARAADFPIVLPTGIYREPWVPDWAIAAGRAELAAWMRAELIHSIKLTGIPAGFIRLSAGDDGMTPIEEKILRAAIDAAKDTGAVIASHTINSPVVEQQLAVMGEESFDPARFIWVHAQVDSLESNLRLAQSGLWIEYDGINGEEAGDAEYIRRIQAMIAAGHEGQLLLSMDRGWYDPAQPGGGTPQPFTLLGEVFLPKLREAGFGEDQIMRLVADNPFNAFGR
jgi:phosphotriesterase-related protein